MINVRQLLKSFTYAWKGFRHVYHNEQNFQIQLFFCLIILILIVFLRVDLLRAGILILLCAMVLVLELLNTACERVADILKPRLHHYVEVVKDIMAAAVLTSSVGALVVGLLILWPYLVRFWTQF